MSITFGVQTSQGRLTGDVPKGVGYITLVVIALLETDTRVVAVAS